MGPGIGSACRSSSAASASASVGHPGAVHGELGKEHQVAAGGGRLLGERLDLLQIRVHLPPQGAEGDHANPHRRLSRSVLSNR